MPPINQRLPKTEKRVVQDLTDFELLIPLCKAGVGSLRSAWSFDIARIRTFVTQFREQNRVKPKLHDKHIPDSMSRQTLIPHS